MSDELVAKRVEELIRPLPLLQWFVACERSETTGEAITLHRIHPRLRVPRFPAHLKIVVIAAFIGGDGNPYRYRLTMAGKGEDTLMDESIEAFNTINFVEIPFTVELDLPEPGILTFVGYIENRQVGVARVVVLPQDIPGQSSH